MPSPQPVVVVVGPTGVGKSDLAIALAARHGGEIVNVDALQVYRGMDIGAAKTPVAERLGVPHHLLDVLDVTQTATVAEFQGWARAAVRDCRDRGALPVLVGGSSLYVRAVVDELEFPGTDPAVRARWEDRLRAEGSEALHALLSERDPAAAAAILPSNGRRIVRALEVGEITGRPFIATMPPYASVIGPVVMIGLRTDRGLLDERLAARVDRMWADGLVEEVRALRDAGIERGLTASAGLGYAQVLAYLRGECTEDQAHDDTVSGTRKFARRQERLFTKDPRITWLDPADPDLLDRASALVTAPA